MSTVMTQAPKARRLAAIDLMPVIAIDTALSGRSRRTYFERRLAAAQRDGERHVQLGIDHEGTLAGFMLGRLIEGEFGRTEPELRLEAFGVKPALQHRGIGVALSRAFEAEAAKRGAQLIRTTALWREHELLRFLDHAGYGLAGSHVLDCALAGAELGSLREEPVAPASERRDFDALARDVVDVRVLADKDIDGIARIDRRHTGRDRRGYLCRTVAEALADSAVRVSLVARVDGAVAGFVMARVDYGDFGRA